VLTHARGGTHLVLNSRSFALYTPQREHATATVGLFLLTRRSEDTADSDQQGQEKGLKLHGQKRVRVDFDERELSERHKLVL
jgi:hypothetical protein